MAKEKIYIYHTNDLHSDFRLWPRIHSELLKMRANHEKADEQVLVFDIGDAADRVHPLMEATAGQAMTQLLNDAHYDAVTIGNNEGTTYSKEALNHLYDEANFSVLLSNLVDPQTGELPEWADAYRIIETKAGARIGIFGLTEAIYDAYEGLGWTAIDPIQATKEFMAAHQQEADFWILLSHLGIDTDRKLAEQFPIDLILGAHTHHALENGEEVAGTWLAGAGSMGDYLGEIHLGYEQDQLVVESISLLDTRLDLEAVANEEAQEAALLAKGHQLLADKIIAYTPRTYEKALFEKSPLMEIVLDAIAEASGTDVAFVNAGLLMGNLEVGAVTADDLHRILPHPIRVMHCEIKGEHIPALMQEIAAVDQRMQGKEPTGNGFRGKQFGKICFKGITIKDGQIYWLEEPIEPAKTYTFASINYFSFFPMFVILNAHTKQEVSFPKLLREVVGDYLAKLYPYKELKSMRVAMTRADLKDIPEYSVPAGFRLRLFQEGDEATWARVETAAGEFTSETQAIERFNSEFGPHLAEFAKRCVFIENEVGRIIGTATAWYGSLATDEEVIGRIHWVSIIPEYQGKGLSKPLLTVAMKILAKYHATAYLTSQTTSYKALNMYQQYDFAPVIRDEQDAEAWAIVEAVLKKDKD